MSKIAHRSKSKLGTNGDPVKSLSNGAPKNICNLKDQVNCEDIAAAGSADPLGKNFIDTKDDIIAKAMPKDLAQIHSASPTCTIPLSASAKGSQPQPPQQTSFNGGESIAGSCDLLSKSFSSKNATFFTCNSDITDEEDD